MTSIYTFLSVASKYLNSGRVSGKYSNLIWCHSNIFQTLGRHTSGHQILNSSSPFHMSHQICKRCFTIFRTRSTIHSSKAYMGTFSKKMGLVCSCVNISFWPSGQTSPTRLLPPPVWDAAVCGAGCPLALHDHITLEPPPDSDSGQSRGKVLPPSPHPPTTTRIMGVSVRYHISWAYLSELQTNLEVSQSLLKVPTRAFTFTRHYLF